MVCKGYKGRGVCYRGGCKDVTPQSLCGFMLLTNSKEWRCVGSYAAGQFQRMALCGFMLLTNSKEWRCVGSYAADQFQRMALCGFMLLTNSKEWRCVGSCC